MFTGIIDSLATIKSIRHVNQTLALAVQPDIPDYEVRPGDSVAVNGVCLTMEARSGAEILFTAVHETLGRTTLAKAGRGQRVNLERAVRPTDRLGGHFVLGHVDGIGRIISDRTIGDSTIRTVRVPEETRIYMAHKGSVAINGVSLTIAETHDDMIAVSLIPYTMKTTTMHLVRAGDSVNIECDVLARYIIHSMRASQNTASGGNAGLMEKMETLGF